MPRAEVGSSKYIANKMKSKGLQRLRWYCQICEKQCRDENGFKCHVNSESHQHRISAVGDSGGARKIINEYSQEFSKDFVDQLRTSHSTKAVSINFFYQQYIGYKEHIHMNATKWSSLTEFAKHLGKEGICRVEDTEKGIQIAWIDNSPEALRRQDAIRRKERMEKGDEEREQKMLQEQIKRARNAAEEAREAEGGETEPEYREDVATGPAEKVKMTFAAKPIEPTSKIPTPPKSDGDASGEENGAKEVTEYNTTSPDDAAVVAPVKLAFAMGTPKSKNVFATASKKNPLAVKKTNKIEEPKKMSETERIAREGMAEQERKRAREAARGDSQQHKRVRLG